MKRPTILLVAACVALLVLTSATADDGSLLIGAIQMRLGMEREPVLERLRKEYKLGEFGDGYTIAEKRGDKYHILGTVEFSYLFTALVGSGE